MEKLKLEHFENQKRNGEYPEKLCFMLEKSNDGTNVELDVVMVSPLDDIPEYEFVKYTSGNNLMPYVKK